MLSPARLQTGNPCLCSSMTKMKSTYSKQMWELGYAETSARSLPFDSYGQLMLTLQQEGTAATSAFVEALQHTSGPHLFRAAKSLLLLLRDCTAFTWEWELAVRAHNSGILQGENVQDRRGQSLLQQLQQHRFPFSAGFPYQFAPNGTKPVQGRRAGSLPLLVRPDNEAHLDCLRYLHALIQVHGIALVVLGSAVGMHAVLSWMGHQQSSIYQPPFSLPAPALPRQWECMLPSQGWSPAAFISHHSHCCTCFAWPPVGLLCRYACEWGCPLMGICCDLYQMMAATSRRSLSRLTTSTSGCSCTCVG